MSSQERNKEMISIMINICTRVVTLVFIIATLFILLFSDDKDIRWSMTDLWGVLSIGIVSGAGFGIFYIKKNMTNRLLLLLKAIYFLMINAVLFIVALKLGWMQKNWPSIALMEVMFILVYFLVDALVYLLDFNEAKKINEKLKSRKKNTQE